MGMRERIAWTHTINQKGDLYLMDTADKTYVVDFGKLKARAAKAYDRMHLFHLIGQFAFPILVIILSGPFNPSLPMRFVLIIGALLLVYVVDYVWLITGIIPQNIAEILEEKKH